MQIKCPKCGFGVVWTTNKLRAEVCLCAVKWVVNKGGTGG